MARPITKTDPQSVARREHQARYQERKRLEDAGLEVPEHLQRRKAGRLADPESRKGRDRDNHQQWALNNKERLRNQLLERRERNRKIANEAKRNPCSDCEESFPPVCMDFDHRDGTMKAGRGVSEIVNLGHSVEKLLTEIAKCDLVCANCHRLRTAERAGWDDSIQNA